jgi:hypothetical protein
MMVVALNNAKASAGTALTRLLATRLLRAAKAKVNAKLGNENEVVLKVAVRLGEIVMEVMMKTKVTRVIS